MLATWSQRTCQANGAWSGKFIQCEPVNCGVLEPPANGGVLASSTTFDSTATYTCNKGFTLGNVSPNRICQANAQWSGNIVNCTVSNEPSVEGESTLNIGAIAGGVAAGAVVIGLIAFLIGKRLGQRSPPHGRDVSMMHMRETPVAPPAPAAHHSRGHHKRRGPRAHPKHKAEGPISREPQGRRVPAPGIVTAGRHAADTLPSKPSTGKQSSGTGSSGRYQNVYDEIESKGTSYMQLERESSR